MPYKVSGKCVHKVEEDGSLGEQVKCHDTRQQAIKHMQALNMNVDKDTEQDTNDMVEKQYQYIEYTNSMPTTFEELDQIDSAVETQFRQQQLYEKFMMLTNNIMNSPDITDKASAIRSIVDEFSRRSEESGELTKEKWTTEYINDLPDSAFLYVEQGEKDEQGKTVPRTNRHFPVKDKSGSLDLPHLRNAIARIPQSDVKNKKELQERARKMLSRANKAVYGKEIEEAPVQKHGVDRIKGALNTLLGKDKKEDKQQEHQGGFFVWKETEESPMLFIARYSNNFRDDDVIPEIISEKSHRRFVELVDSGREEPPDLMVWHVPEWTIGKSTWVAYDDEGFALAAGVINKDCEEIALQISKQSDVTMSHGMPESSIRRDVDDPTVIIEHVTREISILPHVAAANKLTGFIVINKSSDQEDEMAIPQKKINKLAEDWGINPESLKAIEEANKSAAEKATQEGIERKEASEAVEDAVETATDTTSTEDVADTQETQDAQPVQEETQTPAPRYATYEEVAEAFASVVQPVVEQVANVTAQLAELRKEIGETKAIQEEAQDLLKQTPTASLAAIITQRFTAVGSQSAVVDGRESLAKSKPKETEATERVTGIPFLDNMLSS